MYVCSELVDSQIGAREIRARGAAERQARAFRSFW